MTEIISTEFGKQLGAVEFIWAQNSKEFLFSNSILIKSKPCIIVDPSANFTYLDRLATSQSIDIVLNTHYHADHRSLNGLFKNTNFAAHHLDAKAISDYNTYEEIVDQNINSYYSVWRKEFFQKYQIVDSPVNIFYQGNEIIHTEDEEIQLIHTPGHTPGHLALHFKNIDTIYLSDIDLTPYGPWYANVVSNIDDFINSVKKVKSIKANHYVTSHGERIYSYEDFLERIEKFENHFYQREERILDLLKNQPIKTTDLFNQPIVYRKVLLTDPLKYYFQMEMIKKHLEKMIKNQLIIKDNDLIFLK